MGEWVGGSPPLGGLGGGVDFQLWVGFGPGKRVHHPSHGWSPLFERKIIILVNFCCLCPMRHNVLIFEIFGGSACSQKLQQFFLTFLSHCHTQASKTALVFVHSFLRFICGVFRGSMYGLQQDWIYKVTFDRSTFSLTEKIK